MAISITKPTVGGSEDTWGEQLNTALDTVVNAVNGTSGTVAPNHSTLTINGVDVTATAAEINKLDGVTATTAELNILDGVTATAAEINKLDGVTATTAELNVLDGITATTAELNKLDGVTASAAEINKVDGLTATTTELNYVDGVTSNIQTQLNNKQGLNAILTDLAGLTQAASKIPYFNTATTASTLSFLDQDDMSSNSATGVPSQQSVKAYVDNELVDLIEWGGAGGYANLRNFQIRWGTFSSSSDQDQSVTFTTPFSNACFWVMTPISGSWVSKSTTGFVIDRANFWDNTFTCSYIAIGW